MIKDAMQAALRGDWGMVDTNFVHAEPMRLCIQDPIHHAEGDVWTHTRMVFDQVMKTKLDPIQRLVALYHDVAKPETRTPENRDGHIHIGHPHHSRLGAQRLWHDLWLHDFGKITDRVHAYWMVRWHQRIFHLWKQEDMIRAAMQIHVDVSVEDLIEFAICDSRGRICQNGEETIADLRLLAEWTSETNINSLLTDGASRLFFFEKDGRNPRFTAQDPQGSKAVLMSGLPGSGKDTLIRHRFPDHDVISLDDIRGEMGLEHGDNNGQVIQAAFERARVSLRAKRPLVWNATNLTKQTRGKLIGLMRDYDAHVTIVAMATPLEECLKRNAARREPVPTKWIMDRLFKWEPPSLTEAHQVLWTTE